MNSTFLRAIGVIGAWVLFGCLQPVARAQDANRDAVVTLSEPRDIVDRLAKRSGEFREEFEKEVEHSILDGSKFEDIAKRRAADLHAAAKKLKDVFDDKKDKNHPAVRE